MSRIVSVWLPRWPIFRALAAQAKKPSSKPVDPDRPFVLAVAGSGGPRIAALNEAAEILGLATGDLLADARAKAEFLQVRDADPLTVGRGQRRRRFFPRHRRLSASVRRRGDIARRPCFTVAKKFRAAGTACGRGYARRSLGAVALSQDAVVRFALRPGSRRPGAAAHRGVAAR